MIFTGFNSTDFETFRIEGLQPRMTAIRSRIQPKFQAIGQALLADLSVLAGDEMFLHIAQHARRKVNPPKDTWLAFCHNRRGYKKHPHFQIGLFDDRVFIWLAYIYELPDKMNIAENMIQQIDRIRSMVPPHYVLSMDHMSKDALSIDQLDRIQFLQALERFRNVKKAELLIGRHISAHDPLLANGFAFLQEALTTFQTLMPIYKMSR